MPRVVFMGTNGWYDTEMGNTTSILIDAEHYNLILDAGNGFAQVYKYINYDKPAYIYISHFHLDHIIGLHTLQLNKFTKGLTIVVQEGCTQTLRGFLAKPYTTPLENQPFSIQILEFPRDNEKLPFKAQYLQMNHPVPTFGIRAEIDAKVIAYTSDTSYCENAVTLAKNADLLIAECAFKPGESYKNSPHLNPQDVANLAKNSGAKKTVMMHFEARRYPDLTSRIEAERIAQEIYPEIYYSTDGMEVEI